MSEIIFVTLALIGSVLIATFSSDLVIKTSNTISKHCKTK